MCVKKTGELDKVLICRFFFVNYLVGIPDTNVGILDDLLILPFLLIGVCVLFGMHEFMCKLD